MENPADNENEIYLIKDGGESQPMHFTGNRETILVFIEMKLVDSNY